MNRIKIGVSIGLTCLMLIGCQQGIRDYIGAVGLTRVHADENVVCRSNSPSTSSLIEKLGRSIRRALCVSAREAHEQGRAGESSASDRGSDVGTDDANGAADILPEAYGADVEQYSEVSEGDYEEVDSLYSEPEEDYSENLTYLGEFTATAYCSCIECTSDGNGYTASGTLATEGRTIACNALPMGTEVSIDGHTYVVEDTGYTPFGDAWVDIYFDSHDAALAFGVRTVDVYLIG